MSRELIELAQRGEVQAKEALYTQYQPLIYSEASKYVHPTVKVDDLQQEATIAFFQAVAAYDLGRTIPLVTVARRRIREALYKHVAGNLYALAVPPSKMRKQTHNVTHGPSVGCSEDKGTVDLPEFDAMDPEAAAILSERESYALDLLASLDLRSRQIVEAVYLESRPIRQVARQHGITVTRTQQIIKAALHSMRKEGP